MLSIQLPGQPSLDLHHLVLDFNGTLALRGMVVDGVVARCAQLGRHLQLHCVTGDTYGTARSALAGIDLALHVLPPTGQSLAKRDYVAKLGAGVCALGNGWNDRLMLAEAELGLAVMMSEGCAGATLCAARGVFSNVLDALDALLYPERMIALLRD